jgi:hypothetical protein
MSFNNKNFFDGQKPVVTDKVGNINIGNKKFIGDGSNLNLDNNPVVGDIQTALTAILGV